MKKYLIWVLALSVILLNFSQVSAEVYIGPVGQEASQGSGGATVPYCDEPGECGLEEGIEAVGNVGGLRSDVGAVDMIQNIVWYILSFVSLIAVLYIIYAGFQILTWNWEEEKLKKSKQTILYVILGIVVIWLAWPITIFVIGVLNNSAL